MLTQRQVPATPEMTNYIRRVLFLSKVFCANDASGETLDPYGSFTSADLFNNIFY